MDKNNWQEVQKQPFSDVLQDRCSCGFRNVHRKTPWLESLFNKVAGLKSCNFIKKRLRRRCFPVSIFENSLFCRTSLLAASGSNRSESYNEFLDSYFLNYGRVCLEFFRTALLKKSNRPVFVNMNLLFSLAAW